MVTTPSKDAQRAEGEARANPGPNAPAAIPANETALAVETVGDTGADIATPAPPPGPATPVPGEPQQRELPQAMSAFDAKRASIMARFRSDRTAESEAARDEVSDFNQSGGMPAEFRAAAEPEPEAAPAPQPAAEAEPAAAPAPQPQLVTITVRGQQMQVPLEEALSKAQIAYAADDTLEKAKQVLKEIEIVRERAINTVPRADQDGKHHAAPNGTQQPEPAEPLQPAPVDPQHQGEDLGRVIEAIQFGDPEEAKTLLQNTIAREAAKVMPGPQQIDEIVERRLLNERLADEGARTAKVLKDFEDQHPDDARDENFRSVMEVNMVRLQREDLAQLGLDPNRIRPDGQPPTPGDIAMAHRFYRAKGMQVRSPQQLLETAFENSQTWRGVKKEPTPAASQRGAPIVDVSVDRTARRQALPQQPSPGAAPRTPAPAPAQTRDRSDIVAAMRRDRSVKRGQVLGA